MSNVRIFKEIEEKKMRNGYTLVCLQSAELSKAFCLRNICYSKMSVVMLLWYRIAGISRKLESERKKMSCAQMLHIYIANVPSEIQWTSFFFLKMSLLSIMHMYIIYHRLIHNCMFEHLRLDHKSGISCKIDCNIRAVSSATLLSAFGKSYLDSLRAKLQFSC